MKITKHFTTIEGYLRSFERKYKLDRYRQHEDITEPLVCFGMYSKGGMAHIMKHKGLVVIIWSGSDSLNLGQPGYHFFARWCIENKNRVFHLAYSKWICDDLTRVGIGYIEKRVFPMEFDKSQFKVCPLGKKIYFYSAGKPRNEFYGRPTVNKIDKDFGAFNFQHASRNAVPRREVQNYYGNCFVGVRFTEHDNMAMSVLEMSLMGRRHIFNGNVPGALPYTDYDSIIEHLKVEWMRTKPDKELSQETWEFVYDDRKWLDTKYY